MDGLHIPATWTLVFRLGGHVPVLDRQPVMLGWAGLGWARCTLLRGSCEAPAKLVLGSC